MPWRFIRGWNDTELKGHLAGLADRPVSFSTPFEEMTEANGWTIDGVDTTLGIEAPGHPVADGLFDRCCQGIVNYDFSEPRIAQAHFDPRAPLLGRNMLIEIKAFGLRFLSGDRVTHVRDEQTDDTTHFGYRYDTLQGHIEQGAEWFLLRKDYATGAVTFKIEARWRLGEFPNGWSKLGFVIVGPFFRRLWRRLAPRRLVEVAQQEREAPAAAPGELAHGGEVNPERTKPTGG